MLSRDEVIATLRSRKDELRTRFGVNRIGLFGSFARGEASDSSDIDIIVDLERKDIFVRLELKEYLQGVFGRVVDVGYLESLRKLIRDSAKEDLVYV